MVVPLVGLVMLAVGGGAAIGEKVAVTCSEVFPAMVHGAVPEQTPLQPLKVEPLAGAAVRVTTVPPAKLSVQSSPQLIPAGALVTVPDPAPVLTTVTSRGVAAAPHASFD
jgi:hypothetical protein